MIEKSDISKLYEQGLSDPEIGNLLGTSRDNVRYWRRARGLRPNYDKRLEAAKREAVSLYDTGLTCEEVSERIGFKRNTIKKWIKATAKTA